MYMYAAKLCILAFEITIECTASMLLRATAAASPESNELKIHK